MASIVSSYELTPEIVRSRLIDTKASTHIDDAYNYKDFKNFPDNDGSLFSDTFSLASVLVPIVKNSKSLKVLFTKRSKILGDHPGEVSFPGGRMNKDDKNICSTAVRETYEEVGIKRNQMEIIGFLDPIITISGFLVTPIVAFIDDNIKYVIDEIEVESVFEVPLSFLLNPENKHKSNRVFNGKNFLVTEYFYEKYKIWGATAMIILLLKNLLKN